MSNTMMDRRAFLAASSAGAIAVAVGRQPGDRRQRRLGDVDQGADRRRGGDAGAHGARDYRTTCWTIRSTARSSTRSTRRRAPMRRC
ncbi:MAG: twin-arginine translocation signal domain-containing protein [Rhodospirillaceae bacterium]|nr:twin-arginine translocation signal domain-containing protein [Rhodospirillaceae bacterium]